MSSLALRGLGLLSGAGSCLALVGALSAPAPAAQAAGSADDFEAALGALLRAHCLECHSGAAPKGELDLEPYASGARAPEEPALWRTVRRRMLNSEMPPPKRPRLSAGELERAVAWIDREHPGPAPLAAGVCDPGRPALRRLNSSEYHNSVRDLFGVEFPAEELFSNDEVAHGFDTLGEVLALSDLRVEKYLDAAERIAAAAVLTPEDPKTLIAAADGAALEGEARGGPREGGFLFYARGTRSLAVETPRAGSYQLRLLAGADQAGPELARLGLRVSGASAAQPALYERDLEVAATSADPRWYELEFSLPAGTLRLEASFLNDYYLPATPERRQLDRNLLLVRLELRGPLDELPRTRFQESLLEGRGSESTQELLAELALRVWRRPPSAAEVQRLQALLGLEASFEAGLRQVLVALLISPNFLLRVERDPALGEPWRTLDDFELATRLSYLLWSSTPDAGLLELAARGRLQTDQVLQAELTRLLRDPRASALTRDFAGQWLGLRALGEHQVDAQRFPAFDQQLLLSMRRETELCFEAILRENRSVFELIDADWTFVDEALARHYGFTDPEHFAGELPQRVSLTSLAPVGVRGGLLGQASILTLTSNPTRTSPVKRGKWILENLLDQAPPPPPPGVGDLAEDDEAVRAASLRERLEQHRSDPACAACHQRMDTLGFALENYDATGAWRSQDDEGHALDTRGELPDGRMLDGARSLRALLGRDARFLECLARKLAVYALGRPLRAVDEAQISAMLARLPTRDPSLADILAGLVQLDCFRKRGAPPAESLALPAVEAGR